MFISFSNEENNSRWINVLFHNNIHIFIEMQKMRISFVVHVSYHFLCLGKFGTADHKKRQFDRVFPFDKFGLVSLKHGPYNNILGGQNSMPIKLYHPRFELQLFLAYL